MALICLLFRLFARTMLLRSYEDIALIDKPEAADGRRGGGMSRAVASRRVVAWVSALGTLVCRGTGFVRVRGPPRRVGTPSSTEAGTVQGSHRASLDRHRRGGNMARRRFVWFAALTVVVAFAAVVAPAAPAAAQANEVTKWNRIATSTLVAFPGPAGTAGPPDQHGHDTRRGVRRG
jgi:hypothetical protein